MIDIETLSRRALRYGLEHQSERDCWEKGPLLSAAVAYGDDDDRALASAWMRRAIATQRSNGNLGYADSVQGMTAGHIRGFTPLASLTSSLGYPLLLSHQQRPDPTFFAAAARQIEALRQAPRTRDGGIWARAEHPELWIDFTYLMAPFLALYGRLAGDALAIDEAYHQFIVHAEHLLDARKQLARHAWCEQPDHYPQSTFWARGNGWLICAAVDLLEITPQHASAEQVRRTLKSVLEAMSTYQETSGYFCHVLDDPHSNLEASSTLMYAHAAARAITLGVVDRAMLPSAQRALAAVAGAVEPSGKVPGVAMVPGGPGVPFDWTVFGQAFFVLAHHSLKPFAGAGV